MVKKRVFYAFILVALMVMIFCLLFNLYQKKEMLGTKA